MGVMDSRRPYRETDNIFRVGISYHFSPPPAVVARY